MLGRGVDFEYETSNDEYMYVRCKGCGLVYLKNRPDVSELGVIYPDEYIPHRFNEYLGSFVSRLRNFVQKKKVDLIRRLAGDQAAIMDVGFGSGELLKLLNQFGPKGWRLYGADMSAEAVAHAELVGITAQQARFEDLSWQYEPPDILIMNQVIEHLENPDVAIAKAFEILKPGGFFVIETPSVDAWDARLFRERYWGGYHIPRHWYLFDEKSLGSMIDRHGFEIVDVEYILSPNFWLQSVHHCIKEKCHAPRLAKLFDVSFFPALFLASGLDVLQKLVTGKTSNFRMVVYKPVEKSDGR